MTKVPMPALLLGFLGLIPFLWGALTLVLPDLADWTVTNLGPRFVGPYIGLSYGTIILAFMSGVLWGFATRAPSRLASICYGLSVLPALWVFFFVGGGPVSASIYLIFGFAALLLIDWQFSKWGLTPQWWLSLRLPLTAIVVTSLSLNVL